MAHMADIQPPTVVDLAWNGDLRFTASHGPRAWVLDGRNEAGPSPMVALGSALAGCMAIDVVHILTRGRFEVRSCETRLTGRRADNEPRRFVAVDLAFSLDTNAPRSQIDRAIALSRDKYCSVWQSLRQDIELTTSVRITGPDPGLTPPSGR
jgi:putative redox protein